MGNHTGIFWKIWTGGCELKSQPCQVTTVEPLRKALKSQLLDLDPLLIVNCFG